MNIKRVELGCAGHLFSSSCWWRRHTQIEVHGKPFVRVSTVGNYYQPGATNRTTLGPGDHDYFETMTFPLKPTRETGNVLCGCAEVADYSWLSIERYSHAGAARLGHERHVEEWIKKARDIAEVIAGLKAECRIAK